MLALRRTAVAGRSCVSRRHASTWRLSSAAQGGARLDAPPPPVIIAASAPAPTRRDAFPTTSAAPPLTRTAASAAAAGGGGVSPAGPQAPEQQGQQQQATQQFRVHRIAGDGACMFRAIVQGAQVASRGKLMPLESEEAAAYNLRQAVVRELRNRREEIEPFLPGITADFEEYCRTMSHSMAWGGEPEMVMAVHVVQRPITVFHVHGGSLEPIVTYGEHIKSAQPICLLWSGAHYDLLVPAPSPSQPSL